MHLMRLCLCGCWMRQIERVSSAAVATTHQKLRGLIGDLGCVHAPGRDPVDVG
jgi:hypothetical protein